MDWLSFISTDIRSLAWPAAAVFILVKSKNELATLLETLGPRLKTVKSIWGELRFAEGIDDLERKIPAGKKELISDNDDKNEIEQVTELARLPPPYTVSQAWLRLEQAIRVAVDEKMNNADVSTQKRPLSPNAYLNMVTAHQLLPQDTIGVLSELRHLRNHAIHSLEPDISVTDALRYNDIVNNLIATIHQRRAEQR